MAKIVGVIPRTWFFLADALRAAGHDVVTVPADLPWLPGTHPLDPSWHAAILDLRKAIRAIEGLGGTEVSTLLNGLGEGISLAEGVRRLIHEERPDAVLCVCASDLRGRAAVLAAREVGVPSIHVSHACPTGVPEEAWYAAEAPGDWVCLAGERDVTWWQRCMETHRPAEDDRRETVYAVTGNPLWDAYAAAPPVPARGDVPTVLWACETGDNDWQTPQLWESRDVPERAWRAFLEAITTLQKEKPVRVILKIRGGEDAETLRRWITEASEAWRDLPGVLSVAVSQQPPIDVLPEADVVVCQQSNIGIEALMLGKPLVVIGRRGADLFPADGAAILVNGHSAFLTADLWAGIDNVLRATWVGAEAYRNEADYFNTAGDGKATQRVVSTVEQAIEMAKMQREPAHAT